MSLIPQDALAQSLSFLTAREVVRILTVSREVQAAGMVAAKAMLARRIGTLTQQGICPVSGLTEDELDLEWYLDAVAYRLGLEH